MTRIILLSLLTLLNAFSAPRLSLDEGGRITFKLAEVVVRCKVVSRSLEWFVAGRAISVKDKEEIMAGFYATRRHVQGTEGEPSLPVDRRVVAERLQEFYKSPKGRLYLALRCRVSVAIITGEVLKGDVPSKRKVIHCVWEEEPVSLCSHVGEDTSEDKEITLFLNKGWLSQVIVNPAWFEIGSAQLYK